MREGKNMLCSQCKNIIPDNSVFCPVCGFQTASNDTVSSHYNENWYYINEGDRIGPKNADEIISLIKNGIIQRTTLIWTPGYVNWVPADHTKFNNCFMSIVPPVPVELVSDKWL